MYLYIYMIAYSMRRELQSTHIVVDHRIVAIFHILHVCSATNRLISVSPAFPAGRDTAGAPRQRAGDFFRFFNGQRSTHQTTKTRLLKLDENWKQNEFCYRFSFHKRVAFEAEIWHSICGLLVFSACHVKWQENLNHIIYLNPIYNPQPSAKKHLESGQFLDIWDKRCHLLSRWKRLISSPWWNYRDPHWFKTSSDDKKRRRRPSWMFQMWWNLHFLMGQLKYWPVNHLNGRSWSHMDARWNKHQITCGRHFLRMLLLSSILRNMGVSNIGKNTGR